MVVVCKIGGGETGRIGQCGEMNWDDADGGNHNNIGRSSRGLCSFGLTTSQTGQNSGGWERMASLRSSEEVMRWPIKILLL